MTRPAAVMLFGATALLVLGCSDTHFGAPAQPQFIGANSSTVLIDIPRNNPAQLDVARQMANEKCALFGARSAALESLNLRSDGMERASFLCN
ncbi:MAG: hypothetical protein AB7F35_17275 [Acetobacteraceae bacterium]